jgi:hypothetical protein
MIQDVDLTLENLLKQGLPTVTISFDPPDGTFAPTLPALDLFLYDVRENRDLRENDWTVQRPSTAIVTRHPPPIRIACSYLVTAWASDARNEHLLLSQAIRVLLRYPVLPAEALAGSLQGQTPPPPTSALTPGHLQSSAEFWQALGGKPKAAVNYTVTFGMEAFDPADSPIVIESTIRIQQIAEARP